MYTLVFTEDAKKDLKELSKKAPLALAKLSKLLEEVREHPWLRPDRNSFLEKMKSRGNPMVECPGEVFISVFVMPDYFTTYEVKSDLSTVIVPASIAAFCAAVT